MLLIVYHCFFNYLFNFSYLLCYGINHRYSCDKHVIRLLRERTLRNSSTKLYKQVLEQHSEDYLQRVLRFLQAREPFHIQAQKRMLTINSPTKNIPDMAPVPKPSWSLAVYIREVMSQLDELKAKVTSTFGSILKLASTKKVSLL